VSDAPALDVADSVADLRFNDIDDDDDDKGSGVNFSLGDSDVRVDIFRRRLIFLHLLNFFALGCGKKNKFTSRPARCATPFGKSFFQ
jgi:hypothetical protein